MNQLDMMNWLLEKRSKMIVIYDFDGTLTPYALPKYEIFKKCGITEVEGALRGKKIMEEEGLSLYEAYFEAYRRYLVESNIPFNREAVCLGANDVELNKGVLEYFNELNYDNTGLKHYVVTSGFEEYIKDTPINEFLDGIFGTTFTIKDGLYNKVNTLMNEEYKVEAIKKIEEINKVSTKEIIYFGDGLTDKDAFKYVYNNGGKTVFVSKNKKEDEIYKKFNREGIISECFDIDFSSSSELYKYIEILCNKDTN